MTASATGIRFLRIGGRIPLALVALWVVLCWAAWAGGTDPGAAAESDPRGVFENLRRSWEKEDQQALADLVHGDGLRVQGATGGNRSALYSPSQSFYYFKNLFQLHDTDAFIFSRVQETEGTPRVHAMAEWFRHRSGSREEEVLRMMIVLTRDGDDWALAELNIIR